MSYRFLPTKEHLEEHKKGLRTKRLAEGTRHFEAGKTSQSETSKDKLMYISLVDVFFFAQ